MLNEVEVKGEEAVSVVRAIKCVCWWLRACARVYHHESARNGHSSRNLLLYQENVEENVNTRVRLKCTIFEINKNKLQFAVSNISKIIRPFG